MKLLYHAGMPVLFVLSSLILLSSVAFGQAAKTVVFDVASVKPSQKLVGPDYNNQFTFPPVGITGKNVTLKRLIAEAYQVQLTQVVGPRWLDRNDVTVL